MRRNYCAEAGSRTGSLQYELYLSSLIKPTSTHVFSILPSHDISLLGTAIHNYSTLRSLPTLPFPHREERNMRLERHFPSLTRLPNRPFGSHYYYATPPTFHPGHDSIRNFFRLHLPRSLIYSAEEKQARKYEYESSQHPIEVSLTVDRLARFVVAFTGGAFLVVPMLVMVFAPSTVKSVSTVSAAVVLFAVATAFGVRAGNVETLVATATYAAVLMVFVGTSS